jgi:predicted  nucleic acid-binding Zn-ribbon protein
MATPSLPPPEERLTQQERANFLEDYIRHVTAEIDALLNGRNFEAEIKAIKFRIAFLKKSETADFSDRIRLLMDDLQKLEAEYTLKRPEIERLEQERRFYRSQTSGF